MAKGDKSEIVEHTIKVVKDPYKLRDDERVQSLSFLNQYSKETEVKLSTGIN